MKLAASINRAFTLIELLVTVAILALLASLLLGSLAQAKAKAHNIQCISNLRHLALGLKMAIDGDEGRLAFETDARGNTQVAFQAYAASEQGKWWATKWGRTSEASLCPAAPVRKVADRPVHAHQPPASRYPGATRAAWVVTEGGQQRLLVSRSGTGRKLSAVGGRLCAQ